MGFENRAVIARSVEGVESDVAISGKSLTRRVFLLNTEFHLAGFTGLTGFNPKITDN
jgi:hypothetical protein